MGSFNKSMMGAFDGFDPETSEDLQQPPIDCGCLRCSLYERAFISDQAAIALGLIFIADALASGKAGERSHD